MTTSTEQDEMTAWVARHQQGGRLRAEYRFSDLTRLRWDDSSGGTRARTNQYYIHGYVYCDAMLRGGLDHSCMHGPPTHRVKVCVVAVDNDRAVMDPAQGSARAEAEVIRDFR